MNAREYPTRAAAERDLAAINRALGYPRGYTQADVDSGIVVQVGRGCAPLSSIRTESHTTVRAKGARFALPWDETVAKLAGRDVEIDDAGTPRTVRIPSGPNVTIDGTWTAPEVVEVMP